MSGLSGSLPHESNQIHLPWPYSWALITTKTRLKKITTLVTNVTAMMCFRRQSENDWIDGETPPPRTFLVILITVDDWRQSLICLLNLFLFTLRILTNNTKKKRHKIGEITSSNVKKALTSVDWGGMRLLRYKASFLLFFYDFLPLTLMDFKAI